VELKGTNEACEISEGSHWEPINPNTSRQEKTKTLFTATPRLQPIYFRLKSRKIIGKANKVERPKKRLGKEKRNRETWAIPMPIVLLSDFGTSDGYVGAMKGVLAHLAPNVPVIDLSHQVSPFDLVQGGLLLFQAYPYFPRNSVFVAVVDPGVGSTRKAILVETQDYFFIGPDNGLLSMALAEQKVRRIVHLTNRKYFLEPLSATFHGRDLFAPVAAHLAQGLAAEFFGPELTGYERLPAFIPKFSPEQIRGEILHFDRFGNAITNLTRTFLQRHHHGPELNLVVRDRTLRGLRNHYAEAAPGEACLLFGSSQLLEICVNQGSAAQLLGLARGDEIQVPLS